jgi:hypothetical protein
MMDIENTDAPTETPRIGVPDIVLINALRDEVARLNDERVRLNAEVTFANQVIVNLQGQLAQWQADHELMPHVHEEFDVVPEG